MLRNELPSDIVAMLLPYVVAPLAVMTFGLAMWLHRWRAIRQLPLDRRVALVPFVWSLPLLSIILFSINVR